MVDTKNSVTVLYFSIINVLCGAGGDASFAPQANVVFSAIYLTVMYRFFLATNIYIGR